MLITKWLHIFFIEITPDNRTNVANKSEILYDTVHELCSVPFLRPVVNVQMLTMQ